MRVLVQVGLAIAFGAFATNLRAQQPSPGYLNQALPFEARARDLVGRLTLDEKVLQMKDVAPAIPRLGIPEYNWWNEALHGVARSGLATVFPQAIGLAATWDDSAIFRMATVISDEARAKHHEYERAGTASIFMFCEPLAGWRQVSVRERRSSPIVAPCRFRTVLRPKDRSSSTS